jgi:hypothetical protein
MDGQLARLHSTESLRFLHLAQANTRRLTLVRCMMGGWCRVATGWKRAPHGARRRLVERSVSWALVNPRRLMTTACQPGCKVPAADAS